MKHLRRPLRQALLAICLSLAGFQGLWAQSAAAGLYNQGNALYRDGDFAGALQAYRRAAAARVPWRRLVPEAPPHLAWPVFHPVVPLTLQQMFLPHFSLAWTGRLRRLLLDGPESHPPQQQCPLPPQYHQSGQPLGQAPQA